MTHVNADGQPDYFLVPNGLVVSALAKEPDFEHLVDFGREGRGCSPHINAEQFAAHVGYLIAPPIA